VRFGGAPSAFDAQAFDGVVNAAAAGFRAPDTGPLASTQLQPHLFVMDAAFIPVRTRLICDAEAISCRTVDGSRMLLHQLCGQVELYTGKPAPFEVMTEALLEEIRQFGRRAERCGS
jgi:shikimate dehydrogenase